MTMLPDWLGRRARTHAGRIALQSTGTTLTFAELDAAVTRAARRLAAAGIEAGMRVALLARNGAAFAIAAHGIGRCGAVLVPLNVRLTPSELALQLADAAPRLVLYDAACRALAQAVREQLPQAGFQELGPLGPAGAERAVLLRTSIDPGEAHSVIYTSGTTGQAKGALLTWGNFWWSAVGSALTLALQDGDRWLAVLPLFHVGGLSILMRGAIAGITTVVHERFDPERVNHAIDGGVTHVSLVATMLAQMLEVRGDRPYPPSLRCALLGGGPVSPALLERAVAAHVPVALSYGLTESTSQAATLPPERALEKLGSCGFPLPVTELRIDIDGSEAPPGAVGEIQLRGPTIVRAYINRPDETAQAWRDGWFHTGDLGRIDSDGYLYVLDRRDDLIVSGGENVYPAEVEGALARHAAVAEAAVIGMDDERWGRVPLAVIRLRFGATVSAEALRAHCATQLAAYKVPAAFRFIDEPLPRNAAGKLLRRQLGRDD